MMRKVCVLSAAIVAVVMLACSSGDGGGSGGTGGSAGGGGAAAGSGAGEGGAGRSGGEGGAAGQGESSGEGAGAGGIAGVPAAGSISAGVDGGIAAGAGGETGGGGGMAAGAGGETGGSGGMAAGAGGETGGGGGMAAGAGGETGGNGGTAGQSGAAGQGGGAGGLVGSHGLDCYSTNGDFPPFDKGCSDESGCVVMMHLPDCCGPYMMVGVAAVDQSRFAEAEALCSSAFPICDCEPGQAIAEDGNSDSTYPASGQSIVEVACDNGACMSYIPGAECAGDSESCTQRSCCYGLACCAGVPVPPGGEYCSATCPISDHNAKDNFQSVEPEAVLEGVLSLPISRWSYRNEDGSVEHIGPMAQDFKAIFGLGQSDRCIATVDADGVVLAAIQALSNKLDSVTLEQARLREENDALYHALLELKQAE